MNIIVAVSGGVDSVVLLHMLATRRLGAVGDASAKEQAPSGIIVAHFDHGIRKDSSDDARFVAGLAEAHGLRFESHREELGEDASEDEARRSRYTWLRSVAHKYGAPIVTAHHHDDLVGSIAINLTRGTGWRGLAVMGSSGIVRPLLTWRKAELYDYALENRLEWVEDSTNQSAKYLRNRMRASVLALPESTHQEIISLHASQLQLASDIDQQLAQAVDVFDDQRHPYTMVPAKVAMELLRYRWKVTRPAAERLLIGIKTARPHAKQDIGDGLVANYSKQTFSVAVESKARGSL